MPSWVVVKEVINHCWQAPPMGIFKINTYAALNQRDKVTGLRVVIRDSYGPIMVSSCRHIGSCYHSQIVEALAIFEGCPLSVNLGLLPATVDSDTLSVVQAIRKKEASSSEVGVIVNDVIYLISQVEIFSADFVLRLANSVAHGLARLA
ncbi:hypothetical protein Ddye_004470 [Dipteronia dyeriana]|uniref:RNase H type-1 domain-containing protein n=1 Tax=Dipteronia dyeriana TaxID=168575 RepID=A0AAD9XU90_9ROSI|nr:hypothetical protein Ddye_004470 [Dipteronia dyeriana]